jgi:hypothetical protein
MNNPKIGDIIPFGEYNWRVLDVQNEKALIITENIIEQRSYQSDWTDTPWETCDLYEYLNGEFFDKFGDEYKSQIDSDIFVLSVEEATKYFKDDSNRRAEYKNEACWWWLRTPGNGNLCDAVVIINKNGYIDMTGCYVYYNNGGVRPAMWIEL